MSIEVTCDICGKKTHTMSVILGVKSGNDYRRDEDAWLVDMHKHETGGPVFREHKLQAVCPTCALPLRAATDLPWKLRVHCIDRHRDIADANANAELAEGVRSKVEDALTTLYKGRQKCRST
jgi:hypothetical protein